MASGFQATAQIARPIEQVWEALTEWERAPKWMNGIEEMSGPEREAAAEGDKVIFRARGAERESTVAVWSPPRRLVLRSQQGGVTATYEYICTPEGDGTLLTLNARCEMQGVVWRLVGPLIRYLMKRSDSGQVMALKSVLEAASAPQASRPSMRSSASDV